MAIINTGFKITQIDAYRIILECPNTGDKIYRIDAFDPLKNAWYDAGSMVGHQNAIPNIVFSERYYEPRFTRYKLRIFDRLQNFLGDSNIVDYIWTSPPLAQGKKRMLVFINDNIHRNTNLIAFSPNVNVIWKNEVRFSSDSVDAHYYEYVIDIPLDVPIDVSISGTVKLYQSRLPPITSWYNVTPVMFHLYSDALTGFDHLNQWVTGIQETVNRGGTNPLLGIINTELYNGELIPRPQSTFNGLEYLVSSGKKHAITVTTQMYNSQIRLTNARTLSNVTNDLLAYRAEVLIFNWADQSLKGEWIASIDQIIESLTRNDITVSQADNFLQSLKNDVLITKQQIEDAETNNQATIIKMNDNFSQIINVAIGRINEAYALIEKIQSGIGINQEAVKPISDDPLGGFELRTQDQLWRDLLDNLFNDGINRYRNDLQKMYADIIAIPNGSLNSTNTSNWNLFKQKYDDLIIKVPAILDNSTGLQLLAGFPVTGIRALFIPRG